MLEESNENLILNDKSLYEINKLFSFLYISYFFGGWWSSGFLMTNEKQQEDQTNI